MLTQVYNPLHAMWLSTLLAAVPVDRYSYARSPDGYRLWRIRP